MGVQPARNHTTNPAIVGRSGYTPLPYVWTHLAGVYDANNQQIKLYVNGVLDAALGTPGSHRGTRPGHS
jgi:hypothetical protein